MTFYTLDTAIGDHLFNLEQYVVGDSKNYFFKKKIARNINTAADKIELLLQSNKDNRNKQIRLLLQRLHSNCLMLIILTFAYILIAIQISIPNITSNKTFPNCINTYPP